MARGGRRRRRPTAADVLDVPTVTIAVCSFAISWACASPPQRSQPATPHSSSSSPQLGAWCFSPVQLFFPSAHGVGRSRWRTAWSAIADCSAGVGHRWPFSTSPRFPSVGSSPCRNPSCPGLAPTEAAKAQPATLAAPRTADLSPIQKIGQVALATPVGFAFGFVGAWLRDDPAGGALWSVGLACAVLFVVVTLIAVLVDGRLR